MQIFEAWLIYLIIIPLIWAILLGVGAFKCLSHGAALLIALIVGAFVAFYLINRVVLVCPDDKFWLSLLVVVAILVPIIIALVMLISHVCFDSKEEINCDGNVIDQNFICQGDECYPLVVGVSK